MRSNILLFSNICIWVLCWICKNAYFGENCPPWKWRVKCRGRKCINCPQIGKFCKEKRLFKRYFYLVHQVWTIMTIANVSNQLGRRHMINWGLFKGKSSKKTDILWSGWSVEPQRSAFRNFVWCVQKTGVFWL